MKNLHLKNLFVILLLATNIVYASDIKWQISGKIVEENTEEAIPYASIAIYNRSDSSVVAGTISDDQGQFVLERVSLGDYYLVVSFMGYRDYTLKTIEFKETSTIIQLGIIRMSPDVEQLSDVELKSHIKSVKNTVDKQVLNVGSNLSATGGTAADALKLSPSVQVNSEGNVTLRGSSNFKVLINGKPTTLSPDEVLRQTPANAVSKIEVITNPSVKYSAEGGVGVINIILKKGYESGLNGMINASIGTKSKYSGDVNINLNKKKISYSFGIDWRDDTRTAFNDYYRTLYKTDTTHYATMFQDRERISKNLAFRFGLDYNPSEKTNITYAFHTGYTEQKLDINVWTSGRTVPANTTLNRFNEFYLKLKPTFFTNNVGYTKTLNDKGNKLAFNAYYSYIDYYLLNNQKFTLTDDQNNSIDSQPFLQNVLNKNNSHDVRLDADYTEVISEKTTLETGLSYHLYNRFLDIDYARYDYSVNDWVNHPLYTNKYNFDESIYAAYANVNTSLLGLSATFGVRVEYTDRLLKDKNTGTKYKYSKANFFPGASLTKSFNDNESLKLALSNRINRPDEYMMNPFPEFEDDYFYGEGNPYLIPEIVRNLELGYNYNKNKTSFSSTLYYRTTKDKLEQKLTIGAEDKIHTIFHNEAGDKAIGMELMGNLTLADWWTLNANANLYYYDIWANVEGVKTTQDDFSWSTQLVNSFNLGKTTSLQLIGYYNSKTVRSQGELSSYYFLDVALKQQFLDNRLTLGLQCKDILQSLNYELTTATGNMDLLGDFNNESPIILFNVSYKLSNYKKNTKDVETEFDM